jgi:hypothetical protein
MIEKEKFFVTLKTEDKALLNLQKRIDKLCLIQIWIMKASVLFDRYLRTLDLVSRESDSVKAGLLIEEIDICFMSSVSYFLRGFLDQGGSFKLEIKDVTTDAQAKETYKFLMDLRNDEYVHWKGARSNAYAKYSFKPLINDQYEFAKEIETQFNETVGPAQKALEIKELYNTTLKYIEYRRDQDLKKMRQRLSLPETWASTDLLNDNGKSIINRS